MELKWYKTLDCNNNWAWTLDTNINCTILSLWNLAQGHINRALDKIMHKLFTFGCFTWKSLIRNRKKYFKYVDLHFKMFHLFLINIPISICWWWKYSIFIKSKGFPSNCCQLQLEWKWSKTSYPKGFRFF